MTNVAYGIVMPASRGVLTPPSPPFWLPAAASVFADVPNARYWALGRLWQDLPNWLAAAGASVTGPAGRYRTTSGNVLATVAANVPRITYVGGVPYLLYEKAATNNLTQSNLQTSSWFMRQATITPAAASGPDGLTSAALIQEDGTNNRHLCFQLVASGIAAGTPYIDSVLLKSVGRYGWLMITDATPPSPRYGVVVDLTTGTITDTIAINSPVAPVSRVTPGPAGWWRVEVGLTTVGTAGLYLELGPSGSGTPAYTGIGEPTYQGDGTSGVYAYGAQMEVGTAATSLIPTTTAPATRAAESISGIVVPGNLTVTFDDGSTQVLSPAAFANPANLSRRLIATIAA